MFYLPGGERGESTVCSPGERSTFLSWEMGQQFLVKGEPVNSLGWTDPPSVNRRANMTANITRTAHVIIND